MNWLYTAIALPLPGFARCGIDLYLCDAGERYLASYFDPGRVQQHLGDCTAAAATIQAQLA
ncbi:MAG TPA: hypothetical protein VIK56_10275 [Rhodoferax sp.]